MIRGWMVRRVGVGAGVGDGGGSLDWCVIEEGIDVEDELRRRSVGEKEGIADFAAMRRK